VRSRRTLSKARRSRQCAASDAAGESVLPLRSGPIDRSSASCAWHCPCANEPSLIFYRGAAALGASFHNIGRIRKCVQRIWHLQWRCWRACLFLWLVAARARRAIPAPRDHRAPRAMPARQVRWVRPGHPARRGRKASRACRARACEWSSRIAFRDARSSAKTTKSWSRPIAGRPEIQRNSWVKGVLLAVLQRARPTPRWSRFASAHRNSNTGDPRCQRRHSSPPRYSYYSGPPNRPSQLPGTRQRRTLSH
jgi:hypothetical protein